MRWVDVVMRAAAGILMLGLGCRAAVPSSDPRPEPPASDPTGPEAAPLGTTPPEWRAEQWMNSAPVTLASLRGSVVLVRWWTAGCPFCSGSAPALRAFHRSYAPRGLHVIGMYHHKEPTPFDPKVYEETARRYEFTFPIAVDPEWRDFHAWMRDANGATVDTGWTSVTFVLDKHGVVRHFHPGGQYVDGDPAHTALVGVIERLLAES
jgi:peroxiredoxin